MSSKESPTLQTNLIPEAHVRKNIVRVSEATWYRMRNEGKTPSPAIQIRGRRYYRPEVIDRWLRGPEVA